MIESKDAVSILHNVLICCGEDRVPVAMLRPKAFSVAEAQSGDYDVVCDPAAYSTFMQRLFRAVRTEGALMTVNRTKPHKTVVNIYQAALQNKVILEIWTHVEARAGFLGSRGTGYIAAKSIAPHILYRKSACSVLSYRVGSLIYLTHLYHKRKDISHREVQLRLEHYSSGLADHPDVDQLIQDASDGKDLAQVSSKAVQLLKTDDVKTRCGYIARIHRFLWRVDRRIQQKIQPKITVFLGPDGCGKTTVMDSLQQGFARKKLYRIRFKSLYRYFLPVSFFMKWLKQKKRQKRNVVEEWFSSFLSLIALPTIWIMRFVLLRKKLWIMDRYFYDYYYKGIRDKRATRFHYTFFARVLSGAVPRLFTMVVLHCPESVREKRKPGELRPESAERLYMVYLEQIRKNRLHTAVFVSSRDGIEDTEKHMQHLRSFIGRYTGL